jgi:[ribosomal protein S5]-alanine N-acetyltransferase
MKDVKIEFLSELPKTIENKMSRGLVAYEREHGIDVNYKKISLILSNSENQLLGILIAYTAFSEVYVDDLWVNKIYRNRGYGKKLLDTLEDNFKGKGFNNINLVTSAFQAPEFYKKCGFIVEFVRNNIKNPKLTKTFFIKYFDDEEQDQGILHQPQIFIEKKKLQLVDKDLIIGLFNDPLVKRHMPLSSEGFDENQYNDFISKKEEIWNRLGFGPYAYFIKNTFIGWGGIQPDEADYELALVLSPRYWGYGKQIYCDLIQEAFVERNLESVTILFPLSRTKIKWIIKQGFVEEGRVKIKGVDFARFRLKNAKNKY